jgi:hypothetical protein
MTTLYVDSAFSTITSFTTEPIPLPRLDTPVLTPGIITPVSIEVTWNHVSNAVTYRIEYRKIGSTTWSPVVDSLSPQNVTGLPPDTQYEFRITAIGNGVTFNNSEPSIPILISTLQLPIITPPIITLKSYSSRWATLGITLDPQATSWVLRYRTTPSGTWSTVTITANTLERMIEGLIPETGYEFQAKAVGTWSESEWSLPVIIKTLPTGPIPFIVHLYADTNTITVEINDEVTFDHFAVQWRRHRTTNWSESPVIAGNEYTITGLHPATLYDVRVASVLI